MSNKEAILKCEKQSNEFHNIDIVHVGCCTECGKTRLLQTESSLPSEPKELTIADSKEFVVSYRIGEQISPDDFDVIFPSLKVSESTTIGEIFKWYRKRNKVGKLYATIAQLDQLIEQFKTEGK